MGRWTHLSIIDSGEGSCDAAGLPWLLATYVGKGRKKKKQSKVSKSQSTGQQDREEIISFTVSKYLSHV